MRNNNKQEYRAYFAHMRRDALTGIFLGFIPAIAHSSRGGEFAELTKILLTNEWLTDYYGYLFIVFMVLGALKKLVRFGEEWAQIWMNHIFKFSAEVATSLSTALRTGFGVILGFLLTWRFVEPQTFTSSNLTATIIIATITLMLSAFISYIQAVLLSGFRSANPA